MKTQGIVDLCKKYHVRSPHAPGYTEARDRGESTWYLPEPSRRSSAPRREEDVDGAPREGDERREDSGTQSRL